MLSKAKCVLNIPYYDHQILETHRIHKALAMGCRVIAMKPDDPNMVKAYQPYVTFVDDILDLPDGPSLKSFSELRKTYEFVIKQMYWVLCRIKKIHS